jgi:hypothetical protein
MFTTRNRGLVQSFRVFASRIDHAARSFDQSHAPLRFSTRSRWLRLGFSGRVDLIPDDVGNLCANEGYENGWVAYVV